MARKLKSNFGSVTILKYGNNERRMISDINAFNIVDCVDKAIQVANAHNDSKDVKEIRLFMPEYFKPPNSKD